MKTADSLRKLIHNSVVETGVQTDQRILKDALERLEKIRQDRLAGARPNVRSIIMKSPITKLATAAIVAIACLIGLSLWRGTESGIALADVVARMEKVKAYRFTYIAQWSKKVTGEDPNKPYNFETHVTWLISEEYGRKATSEQTDPNGESTFDESYILPYKKTDISIDPKRKKYTRTEVDDRWAEGWREGNPALLTKDILKVKYEGMGRSTIDGIEVEGFRTTDPIGIKTSGRESKIQADQKLWVDVKTRLPVRYDATYVYFYQKENKKEYSHFVVYDFQWDVPVDAADFEPVIPDDYTGTLIKYPAHVTEETVIQGLKLLVELLGKYPEYPKDIGDVGDTVLRLVEESETPAAMRLKEEIKGLTEDEINNKLVDFLMPIRGDALFYLRLQLDRKDPAYYGKTVTPKDADKVLIRWKVSDNEYRVIFGDLHAETVTSAKLRELEAALPK